MEDAQQLCAIYVIPLLTWGEGERGNKLAGSGLQLAGVYVLHGRPVNLARNYLSERFRTSTLQMSFFPWFEYILITIAQD